MKAHAQGRKKHPANEDYHQMHLNVDSRATPKCCSSLGILTNPLILWFVPAEAQNLALPDRPDVYAQYSTVGMVNTVIAMLLAEMTTM